MRSVLVSSKVWRALAAILRARRWWLPSKQRNGLNLSGSCCLRRVVSASCGTQTTLVILFSMAKCAALPLSLAWNSSPLPSANLQTWKSPLRQVSSSGTNALITMDDTLIGFVRAQTADFCLTNKVALIGEFKLTPMAGGLISYGPNQVALWRLIAGHVDKLLKGALPAELPVHQPTTFELVINLKT